MKCFLSCDWGTSSFRLKLVNAINFKVITESTSSEGIATIFALWQKTMDTNEDKRVSFYLNVVKKHINKIEQEINFLLTGTPLIISGMASSSIGFIDIPYNQLPMKVDGTDITTDTIPATKDFDYPVMVISGVRTDTDVMRGEETQLIGCINLLSHNIKNELFIFPGTHSKHIRVTDNQIVDFKTYVTGEFFELLSQKSILRTSIESHDEIEHAGFLNSFKKGVKDAIHSNLLNSAFKVRTNNLFNALSKKENFNYLSGLLIGTELKDLIATKMEKINLLAGHKLQAYYISALKELGLLQKVQTFSAQQLDEATVLGHDKIYQQSLR